MLSLSLNKIFHSFLALGENIVKTFMYKLNNMAISWISSKYLYVGQYVLYMCVFLSSVFVLFSSVVTISNIFTGYHN